VLPARKPEAPPAELLMVNLVVIKPQNNAWDNYDYGEKD